MENNNSKAIAFALILNLTAFFLSFLSWRSPAFGTFTTSAIGVLVLALYLRNPALALSVVFAELAMGGMGWWLRFEASGFELSVRMAMWLAVMGAWGVEQGLSYLRSSWTIFVRSRSSSPDAFPSQKLPGLTSVARLHLAPYLRRPLVVLGVMVVWGMIWGLVRGNAFEAVVLDANGWWYGLLILPLLAVARVGRWDWGDRGDKGDRGNRGNRDGWGNMGRLIECVVGASLATSTLTLVLYHIFMKDYDLAPTLYQWIRDTRLGELTPLFPRGWRIFMQSQVWILAAMGWGMAALIVSKISNFKFQISNYIVITLSLTALLLSLSRSYWIGLTVLVLVFGTIAFRLDKTKVFPVLIRFMACGAVAFGLIYAAQYTPAVGGVGLPVQERIQVSDAAGSSRMNQLKPLLRAIARHPIIGSGFGATVTYTSADPRIVASTAGKSGQYSTYAFEWGYLDMWLKIGLIGVIGYIWLIGGIMKGLWRTFIGSENFLTIPLALFCALIALAFVNITSPYLNHPLGIGMVVLGIAYAASIGSHRHV